MRLPTAGDLDRLVRIEFNTPTASGAHGTMVDDWRPLVVLPGSPVVAAQLWAEIQDALPSRSEAVTQGLNVARNQSRIRMRYRSDVTSAMRIVDVASGYVYQIIGGPAELGRRQFIEMQCERVSV